jgi:hypothetical protein
MLFPWSATSVAVVVEVMASLFSQRMLGAQQVSIRPFRRHLF